MNWLWFGRCVSCSTLDDRPFLHEREAWWWMGSCIKRNGVRLLLKVFGSWLSSFFGHLVSLEPQTSVDFFFTTVTIMWMLEEVVGNGATGGDPVSKQRLDDAFINALKPGEGFQFTIHCTLHSLIISVKCYDKNPPKANNLFIFTPLFMCHLSLDPLIRKLM